jgi:phage terminase small subunit
MIKRGRKSEASLSAVVIPHARKSPAPPPELNEAAAKIWKDIVKSWPTEYFRAGDLPLLQAYCTAADRKNQIDKLIAEHGVMFEGEPHPGLKVSRDEASLMATLAVKLRLSQSSRIRADSASLKVDLPERKPWDMQ